MIIDILMHCSSSISVSLYFDAILSLYAALVCFISGTSIRPVSFSGNISTVEIILACILFWQMGYYSFRVLNFPSVFISKFQWKMGFFLRSTTADQHVLKCSGHQFA